MGVSERRARQKEALRREILDAARRLFAKEGYDGVSMRDIAAAIEYSPATIYLHFADKRDLFDCLCRETLTSIGDMLEPIISGGGRPLERMRLGLRAYIQFGLENPEPYRVAFLVEAPDTQTDALMDKGAPAYRAYQLLSGLVRECAPPGELAKYGPDRLAQTLWAGVHGLVSLLITDPLFPWIDREVLIDTMIQTLTAGLSDPASASNGKSPVRAAARQRS